MVDFMEKDKSKTSAGNYEYLYRKYDEEVSICVKIPHAVAFRHQCKPQKQFADSGS